MSISRAWVVAFGAVGFLVATFYAIFSFSHLYHMDTVLYAKGIRSWLAGGELGRIFPTRFLNDWLYLPAYSALGDAGFKWTNVAIVTILTVAYTHVVAREFSPWCGLLSGVLLILSPPTILRSSRRG